MTSCAMDIRWCRWATKLGAHCLLICAALRCEAQNLVPNPGFEIPEDSCSWQCCFNVGSRPLHWFSWMNSPEHFNACAGGAGGYDSLVAVPHNGWTYQSPWDGDAYAGVRTYDGGEDYREYMGAQLIEPLVPGCTYQLRFRTNPAYGGNYWLIDGGTACDNVGLLLTTTSNAWPGTTGQAFGYRNFAHLRTTVPVADTLAWTLVEGTIVADSAYAYVVLGNFYPDSLTNAIPIGNPVPWTGITYYLFDGVEVVPVDTQCHGVGVQELEAGKPMVEVLPEAVRINWQGGGEVHASLIDPLGRLCHSGSDGSGIVQLPLPEGSGLYILHVERNGRSYVQKFVLP